MLSNSANSAYSFKLRCKSGRNEMWRKKGTTHCVYVPRSDLLLDTYVGTTLMQCGMSKKDADAFLAAVPAPRSPKR